MRHSVSTTALRAILVMAIAMVISPAHLNAQDNAEQWDQFKEHDGQSALVIDHAPLTAIIKAIAVRDAGSNKLAFSALTGKTLDYLRLYIRFLEQIPVSTLNRNEQLAYWLNLHNAAVLEHLAANKKLQRRVKRERGEPTNPGKSWSVLRFTVEGKKLSLNDIEQHVLLANWQDPLVLYGLCYGVRGSSVLQGEAFSGKTVKAQLAAAAKEFINDSKKIRVKRGKVEVSTLHIWNQQALFNSDPALLIDHIKTYANDKLIAKLEGVSELGKDRFRWGSVAYIPRQQNFSTSDFGSARGGAGS